MGHRVLLEELRCRRNLLRQTDITLLVGDLHGACVGCTRVNRPHRLLIPTEKDERESAAMPELSTAEVGRYTSRAL